LRFCEQVLGGLIAHVVKEAVEYMEQPGVVGAGGAGSDAPKRTRVLLKALVLAVPDCLGG
jgi:hypothetical protein